MKTCKLPKSFEIPIKVHQNNYYFVFYDREREEDGSFFVLQFRSKWIIDGIDTVKASNILKCSLFYVQKNVVIFCHTGYFCREPEYCKKCICGFPYASSLPLVPVESEKKDQKLLKL